MLVSAFEEAVTSSSLASGEKYLLSVPLGMPRPSQAFLWVRQLHTSCSLLGGKLKGCVPSLDPVKPGRELTASFLLAVSRVLLNAQAGALSPNPTH